MKKIGLCLVGLILVLAFARTVETSFDVRSYNPIVDLNRDGKIDVRDIAKVAIAYGSIQALPTQRNQTVVYVYQLETDPPEIQNVCVAIAELPLSSNTKVVRVGYTNLSGITNFMLSPNTNYTAIAWSNKTYNYAYFTTNEFSEVSAVIQTRLPASTSKLGGFYHCQRNFRCSYTRAGRPYLGTPSQNLWRGIHNG